jgi:ABC-2 type transport system permease protein
MLIKELHPITRDARSLALALAMPFMMPPLYGYALSLDVDKIPTLIYDQDGTTVSRALTRQFQGSGYFEVRGFADSYAPIEHDIDNSKILIGVAILGLSAIRFRKKLD